MAKKQKIILIVIIIILILVIGITTFFLLSKKDKEEITKKDSFVETANDNTEIIKQQTVDGIKISNIMLIVKEEGSTFTANVTNTTNEEIKGKTIEITFKTSTDKKILSLLGYYGDSIKPGETKQLSTNTSRRLNKNIIKNIEYKIN